ncbi:VTT domain-containing protein [Lysobacter koreensis]|uniref:TVP38/TMEM64 family membrane protein n=1 Tax=Lysobacter koreensis TaxID=266122 RepID=A0ABW2YMK7_9GAMM
MTTPPPNPLAPPPNWRRALALLLVFAALAALLSVDALYAGLLQLLTAAQPWIAAHPGWGQLLFVLLSALSAMLAFFSSAVLVPAAVYSWGKPVTAVLLWLGWLLGGLGAYGIGRALGRPLLGGSGAERLSGFYRQRLSARVGVPVVFLLQLGLPSEIPGYLCGLLQVRLRVYLAALALAELPYAIGTVWVGESILQREGGWLLGLGVLAALTSGYALYLLHKALRR